MTCSFAARSPGCTVPRLRTSLQALTLCYDAAKSFVERQAVQSMLALLPTHWGDAVAATAAAVTAHTAMVSCMSVLQTQVRSCIFCKLWTSR